MTKTEQAALAARRTAMGWTDTVLEAMKEKVCCWSLASPVRSCLTCLTHVIWRFYQVRQATRCEKEKKVAFKADQKRKKDESSDAARQEAETTKCLANDATSSSACSRDESKGGSGNGAGGSGTNWENWEDADLAWDVDDVMESEHETEHVALAAVRKELLDLQTRDAVPCRLVHLFVCVFSTLAVQ
jgi:hypothetical protein